MDPTAVNDCVSGWARWGTIGDTFGGLANLGTLFAAIFVLVRTLPNERKRLRLERLAAAAERLYLASNRLISALEVMADPFVFSANAEPGSGFRMTRALSPSDQFRLETRDQVAEVMAKSAEFSAERALVELHFDAEVASAMDAVWKKREAMLAAHKSHAVGLDNLDKQDPAPYQTIYGSESRADFPRLRAQLRSALRKPANGGL